MELKRVFVLSKANQELSVKVKFIFCVGMGTCHSECEVRGHPLVSLLPVHHG